METRLAPGFLIAMPQLLDPSFARSVVLLLHADDEGALGLVISRPTQIALDDFCKDHDLAYGGGDERVVWVGGPCEQRRGFLLHAEAELETTHVAIAPGLLLSSDASSVRTVLERGRGPYRFLLGYAGWGPGQLEAELAEGAWLTATPTAERVFTETPEALWRTVLADLKIDPSNLCVSSERH